MTRRNAPSIPVGRIRRGARLGGLLGVETARRYVTRAANVNRAPEDRKAAEQRRRLEAADHMVEVLGQMKGAAMKVGQMAALMDFGELPADGREEFQAKLAQLNDSAPKVSFNDMRKVIEHDLGDRISNLFADFNTEAAAAASIGQVFRARLHDGREVAVKVQYPGVGAAVRADLQNLGLLTRAMKHFAPGLDAKSLALEVRERIGEELDYEHEAQAQRMFARRWRGHPFITVPDVVSDLSREHVLVTEWMDGIGFEQVKAAPQATRDRVGEIVFRFFFGSLYRFGHFSGDPHPGNFLLLGDGRVAFLDFGMTKMIPRRTIEAELGVLRAALEGDAGRTHAGLASLGFFELGDPRFDPEQVLQHVRALNRWYADDHSFTLTPQYVSKVMVDAVDPHSDYWDLTKNETVPADSLFSNRMQAMTLSAIGQLRATANWHRVMSEWIYDSAPCSPLGLADAEFFATRSGSIRRAA